MQISTHDLHMAVHDTIGKAAMSIDFSNVDTQELLREVRDYLSQQNHQAINYGDLPSMLHLHMLCHAVRRDTKIYAEINGVEYAVNSVRRRVDSIGRQDIAITLVCDNA